MHSLILGALLCVAFGGPDRVTLQDGKKLEGRVVCERKDAVVLKLERGERTIARAEIAELVTLERSLSGVLERDLQAADAAQLRAAAKDCSAAGLDADARLLWLRTLLREPSDEQVIGALGAKRVKDAVVLPFGKRGLELSQLRAPQAKWSEAFELASTHFQLRTDLPLETALDALLGLERFHVRFYGLVGDPLGLYVFDERQLPELRLYARAADFPAPPVKGPRVWFAPLENVVHVDASSPVPMPDVVADLTRQMLFSALRRGAGPTAQLQPWIATGIAEALARSAPEQAGGAWRAPQEAYKPHFTAAAASQLSFDTLFQAAPGDFTNGARAGEYSACAYSLLHFFFEARDGALRQGLGRYIEEGAKGKLSLGALSECVGLTKDQIQAGWRAHVAQFAR